MTVGENIKRIRKEKGLTQKKLGELCNIDEANIRKYENGKQKPKIETLQKIATALDVPIIELKDDLSLFIDKTITQIDSHMKMLKEYELLNHKFNEIGCSIEAVNIYGDVVITFPDGKIEVTKQQLLDLNKQNCDYLKFQLEQLKKENAENSKSIHKLHVTDRTDIEVTDEMKKHDNDVMNDENF